MLKNEEIYGRENIKVNGVELEVVFDNETLELISVKCVKWPIQVDILPLLEESGGDKDITEMIVDAIKKKRE